MIERIKIHNYLNGFVFSMIEFLIVGLILMPFTVYYFLHSRFFYGMAGLGIILNSLLISAFAINSLNKKEKDLGLRKLFNPQVRHEMHNKYPNLQRDTYILSALILLPFMLCVFCLIDWLKNNRNPF